MKSRPTMMKRARERARAEKQKEKAARRLERAQQGGSRGAAPDGVDPDIAHIQAGPQPPADWQVDAAADANADEDETTTTDG
jgi:hypothetical protein